jgi:hypothetical protein
MGLEPTTFCMASRRSSQLSYIRKGAQYSLGHSCRGGPRVSERWRYPWSGATWRSGYAGACKALHTGSIPVVASQAVPTTERGPHAGALLLRKNVPPASN